MVWKEPGLWVIAFKRSWREARSIGLIDRLQVIRILFALYDCDHKAILEIASKLLSRNSAYIGFYYLAFSNFALGDYAAARELIDEFLALNEGHVDGFLLKSEIERESGNLEDAWRAVEIAALISGRAKILLQASNLVSTPSDFVRLRALHEILAKRNNSEEINYYLVGGALRAREYSFAHDVLRSSIERIIETGWRSPLKQKKRKLSPQLGRRALADLKRTLDSASIPFFLISGTFLACIRDGRLIGYDNDIDVGVWEDIDLSHVIKILKNSGFFVTHAQRSLNVLRLNHLNGVAIDIFWHHRESSTYWHSGVKVRWNNSAFTLEPYEFLGMSFLGPKESEKYLSENYGNWRIPARDFDSAYDTPNAEVVNWDEMIAHTYLAIMRRPSMRRLSLYLSTLESHGEAKFVSEFKGSAKIAQWVTDRR